MKERIPDPVEPKNNGDSPAYVLVKEAGGHHTFGPYNKTFAEHLSEVFNGTVLDCKSTVMAEIVEIKKHD